MLDGVLIEEQAGFRKGRGCRDQIFVVRHLMEHANEMKASLSLCFVDFEKAFEEEEEGRKLLVEGSMKGSQIQRSQIQRNTII